MDTEVYKKSQEFLQTEGMQKIMVSTDFYFQKARDAFYKFMEYDNRRLIEEIIDWTYNKQRYSDRNDVQELAYSGGYPFIISGDIRSVPS